MPIMSDSPETGGLLGMVSAAPGLSVLVAAPPGTDVLGIPPGGMVIGWILVADAGSVGGARVDPVFLADGSAWTPDQYRAAYGRQLTVRVGRTS